MDKKFNQHFSSGEFAKLCNVSKHTLFYYDEIGLFSPEIIDSNGYRYYSVNQYDTFGVITIFKDLGMTLKEIKQYLDNRNPASLVSLLKIQNDIISKKIDDLTKIKTLINHKIQITENASTIDSDSIDILELVHDEYFIISEEAKQTDDLNITKYIANLINLCNEKNIFAHYSIIGIHHKKDILDCNYVKYSHFGIKIDEKCDISPLPYHIKPKGLYLTAYHKGNFDTIGESYERIKDFAHKKNLNLGDFFYEEFLLDPLSIKKYNEYLSKISIALKKDH
ncbi:MAG: MerR family transcriptional regulator [Proteocatella sp.]